MGEFRSDRWQTQLARRYSTAEVDNFQNLLTSFLGEWNQVRGKGERITGAGFGVAGPATGNKVKMTHRPLTVDGDAISERMLIPKVRVVNDLAAAARGLDVLGPRDLVTIQAGKAAPAEPRVVLGVGTGLGIAYLMPEDDGYAIIPGEGGHAGFAPATLAQARLWQAIFAHHGRVAAEDVVSGMGLIHIFSFLRSSEAHAHGEPEDTITADWLAERAAKGDLVCSGALDLFAECLGNVAGDHALAVMARGGVYLAGGVITRIHARIRESRFSEAFCAKGAHSATMMKIPVKAVTSDRVGLLGAAKLMM
ncbi:MAG: glucokinase [Burkholderiales bacterium]|nr:glucokinase [Burkholderiales bacterium]